jgi:alcohol dehydrogenase (NADP+)
MITDREHRSFSNTRIGSNAAELYTGAQMPYVGLGTWKAAPGEVEKAIGTAVRDAGYRHLDCAACYGNEAEIGVALVECWTSGLSREEIFITSKLWNSNHGPENVEAACRQTITELQLNHTDATSKEHPDGYLDLYLVHWPQAFEFVASSNRAFPRNEDQSMRYDLETSLLDTWRAMEKLVELGLCKHIGLSNFNSQQIISICDNAQIQPAVLQVESHPYFQQEPLFTLCKSKNIVCTAYSPLGSGASFGGNTVVSNPVLAGIGAASNRSAAQVALSWQVERGIVVIPKSVKEERIYQNNVCVEEFGMKLSDADMANIRALDENTRGANGWGGPMVERNGSTRPRDELHPNYPFNKDDPTVF